MRRAKYFPITKDQHDPTSLFDIAAKMKKFGLNDSFIVNTVKTALEFAGVADLMNLWANEKNDEERDQIIADIQDMIDACN